MEEIRNNIFNIPKTPVMSTKDKLTGKAYREFKLLEITIDDKIRLLKSDIEHRESLKLNVEAFERSANLAMDKYIEKIGDVDEIIQLKLDSKNLRKLEEDYKVAQKTIIDKNKEIGKLNIEILKLYEQNGAFNAMELQLRIEGKNQPTVSKVVEKIRVNETEKAIKKMQGEFAEKYGVDNKDLCMVFNVLIEGGRLKVRDLMGETGLKPSVLKKILLEMQQKPYELEDFKVIVVEEHDSFYIDEISTSDLATEAV